MKRRAILATLRDAPEFAAFVAADARRLAAAVERIGKVPEK